MNHLLSDGDGADPFEVEVIPAADVDSVVVASVVVVVAMP